MSKVKDIRVKRQLDAQRFSRGVCAKVCGVSTPTYRKLEEHPENFTKAQAVALAKHLGCSEEDIFL